LKVAGIVAAGALVSAVVVFMVRDGEGPSREGTHVEASLSTSGGKPFLTRPVESRPTAGVANPPPVATTAVPALTAVELERQLAASNPADLAILLAAELPAMVAKNPAEVARFAELQTEPRLRELLVRQVAQLWAGSDPDRAMAWTNSLPDSPERVATLIDLSLTVAQTDPQRAVNFREPQVGNIEPDGVLEGLVQQWAQRDFDAALAWANARPRNAQRDKLLQRLVYVRAAAGAPEEAAKLADESFAEGAQKVEAIATVARQWTQADPVAANAWLQGLDEATARSALRQLYPAIPPP
jgi:hypothetical protein